MIDKRKKDPRENNTRNVKEKWEKARRQKYGISNERKKMEEINRYKLKQRQQIKPQRLNCMKWKKNEDEYRIQFFI